MAAGRCGDVCKARLLQELTAVRELRRPRAPEAFERSGFPACLPAGRGRGGNHCNWI